MFLADKKFRKLIIISFKFDQSKLLLIQKGYIAVETSSTNEKCEKRPMH